MLTQFKSRARLSVILLWIGFVVADTTTQLMFKSAAIRFTKPTPTFAWVMMVAQSWRIWSAVACLLITFGLWMLVLRRTSLSAAFPMTSLAFVGIVAGSWWLFGETIAPIQYAGIALIIAGVAALRLLDD